MSVLSFHRVVAWALAGAAAMSLLSATVACADSPFAASVVSYTPGAGAVAGFTEPSTTLGSPERFTGEGLFPQCVTPFQPAYRPNEIVSIGAGGSLVVAFDHDVLDDPRNPFGVDLLVFGNAFFTDSSFGQGVVAGLASEGGSVWLSADGVSWTPVPKVEADGLFPTLGYLDAGPFQTTAGSVPSDFLRPVDPALLVGDLAGLGYEALVELYDGSGGGVGIDLAAVGLARVRFVRIDGPAVGYSAEIDAFADVAPVAPSADLDGDGAVNASDLAAMLGAWGTATPAMDLDGDGVIGAADLALILGAWTGGTP
ncbi:MAG: dockerin type I repeat-containing protein [Planctomycetaceae bacterium]|nr:dockerin type I repeat-containing protein [Planctomycetaceae bacterium]